MFAAPSSTWEFEVMHPAGLSRRAGCIPKGLQLPLKPTNRTRYIIVGAFPITIVYFFYKMLVFVEFKML
jgi:hypothetical protein